MRRPCMRPWGFKSPIDAMLHSAAYGLFPSIGTDLRKCYSTVRLKRRTVLKVPGAGHTRSSATAMPWPTPMHMVENE
ncbi:hypothetical protein J2Z50_002490 [Ensifer mexicanus]|nr:hypothetical protein [Sinorhizobium mexicanum]